MDSSRDVYIGTARMSEKRRLKTNRKSTIRKFFLLVWNPLIKFIIAFILFFLLD
jgi:hypothetical protein